MTSIVSFSRRLFMQCYFAIYFLKHVLKVKDAQSTIVKVQYKIFLQVETGRRIKSE